MTVEEFDRRGKAWDRRRAALAKWEKAERAVLAPRRMATRRARATALLFVVALVTYGCNGDLWLLRGAAALAVLFGAGWLHAFLKMAKLSIETDVAESEYARVREETAKDLDPNRGSGS